VYISETGQAVLPRYSYRDTWIGSRVYFDTMKEVVESAKYEYGVSVDVHDAETGNTITVKASGRVPV
jgi:hypothetical protein